jgi:Ser-tRNA(Ala) deacylase AlaX
MFQQYILLEFSTSMLVYRFNENRSYDLFHRNTAVSFMGHRISLTEIDHWVVVHVDMKCRQSFICVHTLWHLLEEFLKGK